MIRERIYPTTLKRMSADEICAKLSAEPEEAARWIYAAAMSGSAPAQTIWGQILLDGRGVAADPDAALRWFKIAALSGYADGINMVGRCTELGWGTAADPAEAARWFRQAAAKGHAWAQFNLASLMLKGEGVAHDARGALTLLVRSARQGNPKAMNMIGRCRELGWGGPAKAGSAVRWYRRAADRGCFRGSYHLGRFLATRGDIAAAAIRFRASVDAAPADFCREAADVLLASPEPDLQAVGRVAMARAAETDAARDLFAYGHALATGRGGAIDLKQAKVWIARAHAKNYPGAMASLQDIFAGEGVLNWLGAR